MRLSKLRRPFICAVIAEPTASESIAQIDRIESTAGVDAFEVNIAPLELSSTKDVFASTHKPCIATHRRAPFMKVYGFHDLPNLNETNRSERLLKALDFGAEVIDFELDMFDEDRQRSKPVFGSPEERKYALSRHAKPTEVTNRREAMRMQRTLVEKVKSVGGEVVISSHPQVRIRKDQVLRIARTIQLRGADFAKIVIMTFDSPDLIVMQNTAVALNSMLRIPFNLMNMGENAVLGRLLSVFFGSSWIYCRPESDYNYGGQPTVGEAKDFLRKFTANRATNP